jgi:hypothetical protein
MSLTIKDLKEQESRYIISFSTMHPLHYIEPQDKNQMYVSFMDIHTNDWQSTPIFTEAQSFTFGEANVICSILNKINKCYFIIVPTFGMQIIESKLNTFPDE